MASSSAADAAIGASRVVSVYKVIMYGARDRRERPFDERDVGWTAPDPGTITTPLSCADRALRGRDQRRGRPAFGS
jgi:hypothetical protein